MRPWRVIFVDFTNYLRDCGWRQPIIMRGRKVKVVGVGSWSKKTRCANDNRRQA